MVSYSAKADLREQSAMSIIIILVLKINNMVSYPSGLREQSAKLLCIGSNPIDTSNTFKCITLMF